MEIVRITRKELRRILDLTDEDNNTYYFTPKSNNMVRVVRHVVNANVPLHDEFYFEIYE